MTKFSGGFKQVLIKAKNGLHKAVAALDNAIYPKDITCDLCGNELVAKTRINLCAACIEKTVFTEGKLCKICGVPIHNEADYCLRCQNGESVFNVCRSPLVYDGTGKQLILNLKYGKKEYIAKTLGALMADTFISCRMEADVIVFVPMSAAEEKHRGFNQSELLAYELGNKLNIPVLPALQKIKDTTQQKSLTAKQREENLKDAFICVFSQVKGLKVLLVDDVFTTGATSNECSRVLYKARAKQVNVLTAAVTPLKLLTE